MKRLLATAIMLILFVPMFQVLMPHAKAGGSETTIFQDNFESYALGTFPTTGGWQIVWNGAGDQYQVVTDSYSNSATKSLQLMGSYGWSAVVKKDFSSSSNIIGYEAYLMALPGGGGSVAFCNIPIATWGRYYAMVAFTNGSIWACEKDNEGTHQLQPFTPYTWYKIRVVVDRTAKLYNVWIDDALKGQNIPIYYDPYEILSLQFQVGWVSIKNYFDDVKVFEVSGSTPSGPVISSVSTVTATRLQTIDIKGSGFGNTWPQTVSLGDGSVDTLSSATPYMCLSDNGKYQRTGDSSDGGDNWAAGIISPGCYAMVGIILSSWSDNEIILGGFGTALGVGQGTWYIADGDPITVTVVTSSGQAAYTVVVGATPPGTAPVITSVSTIAVTNLQTIYIYGSGFGNTWPQTVSLGDGSVDTVKSDTTPSIAVGDDGTGSDAWGAGYTDFSTVYCAIGIILVSWSENEIVLGGFGTALGTNGQGYWNIAPGDPIHVQVWTPGGYAIYNTNVAGAPPSTYSVSFDESGVGNSAQVWSVTLDGYGTEYSNGPGNTIYTIVFTGVANGGPYQFIVTPPSGFVAQPTADPVAVNGGDFIQSITFNPVPVTYTFTLTAGSGGTVSYSFSLGSGTVPSGQSQQLTVPQGCQFTLTANPDSLNIFQTWSPTGPVSVSDPSSASTTATVNGNGCVTANFAYNLGIGSISPSMASIQLGQSVAFTATPSGGSGGYTYMWHWTQYGATPANHGSQSTGTSNKCTFTPSSAGDYGVYVVVTDSAGNVAQSLASSVTVLSGTTVNYKPIEIDGNKYQLKTLNDANGQVVKGYVLNMTDGSFVDPSDTSDSCYASGIVNKTVRAAVVQETARFLAEDNGLPYDQIFGNTPGLEDWLMQASGSDLWYAMVPLTVGSVALDTEAAWKSRIRSLVFEGTDSQVETWFNLHQWSAPPGLDSAVATTEQLRELPGVKSMLSDTGLSVAFDTYHYGTKAYNVLVGCHLFEEQAKYLGNLETLTRVWDSSDGKELIADSLHNASDMRRDYYSYFLNELDDAVNTIVWPKVVEEGTKLFLEDALWQAALSMPNPILAWTPVIIQVLILRVVTNALLSPQATYDNLRNADAARVILRSLDTVERAVIKTYEDATCLSEDQVEVLSLLTQMQFRISERMCHSAQAIHRCSVVGQACDTLLPNWKQFTDFFKSEETWSQQNNQWLEKDKLTDEVNSIVAKIGVPKNMLTVTAKCPVYLNLFDDQGRCVGYNLTSGTVETQIEAALWGSNQTIYVFAPSGEYRLQVIGTEDGVFALQILEQNEMGDTMILLDSNETIARGSSMSWVLSPTTEGAYIVRVHDVAVTNVVAVVPHCSSKVGKDLWVFQGLSVYVNVTVLNEGDFDENVTVTLYYNMTANEIIGAQNVTLSPGQNETVAFAWDTTGVPYCQNYTLTALATVPLDINPADNTQACGPITVRIMGDINGDGKVDGRDIVTVARAFSSCGPDYLGLGSAPSLGWNLDADINGDNKVDGRDLVLAARNFGK